MYAILYCSQNIENRPTRGKKTLAKWVLMLLIIIKGNTYHTL